MKISPVDAERAAYIAGSLTRAAKAGCAKPQLEIMATAMLDQAFGPVPEWFHNPLLSPRWQPARIARFAIDGWNWEGEIRTLLRGPEPTAATAPPTETYDTSAVEARAVAILDSLKAAGFAWIRYSDSDGDEWEDGPFPGSDDPPFSTEHAALIERLFRVDESLFMFHRPTDGATVTALLIGSLDPEEIVADYRAPARLHDEIDRLLLLISDDPEEDRDCSPVRIDTTNEEVSL